MTDSFVPPPLIPAKNSVATASMVCGILALPTCFATALPAIITGHIAKSRIQKSGGLLGGSKAAIAGLILGYGSLALIPLIAILAGLLAPIVIEQRNKADQVECLANVRELRAALPNFGNTEAVMSPFPADLSSLDSLPNMIPTQKLLSLPERHAGDWLYFPQSKPGDASVPLLISPVIGKKSVTMTGDLQIKLRAQTDVDTLVNSSPSAPVHIPAPLKIHH